MNTPSKNILITGSASGLGLALAKKFFAQGCEIYGMDIKPTAPGLDWQNYFQIDLSNYQKVTDLIQQIGAKIDILINNAGIWLEGDLETNSISEIQNLININLTSQIVLTNQLLPFLKQKQTAKIANISSVRGIEASSQRSVYCASKFGIRGFTESLQMELEPLGIKVFGFYPAGIKTNLFKQVEEGRDLSDHLEPENLAELIFSTITNSDTKYYTPSVVIQKT